MKLFFTLLFFCIVLNSISQNLVPNPSFEDTVACPNGFSQTYYAKFWNRAKGSPDYFNSCYNGDLNNGNVSIPKNSFGYQNAASGNAYAGFYTYLGYNYNPNNHNEREWLKCSLISPLIIGKKYNISFKISLADSLNCASNNIGILFSTVSIYYPVYALLNNFTHFNNTIIIQDTTNWTTVQGSFISDSAYNYIIIGNFYDFSLTDSIFYPNRPVMQNLDSSICWAYYYLDDISVVLDTTNSIFQEDLFQNITIFPNPTKDIINIGQNYDLFTNIIIFNMLGEPILIQSFSKNLTLDLSSFPDGIYFIQFLQNNNKLYNKTFTQKINIIK